MVCPASRPEDLRVWDRCRFLASAMTSSLSRLCLQPSCALSALLPESNAAHAEFTETFGVPGRYHHPHQVRLLI
ncbi:hypothetical protein PsYK624_040520 [Phanerochaete sordida]|uniref:Uncharacterized protein n=1 Tax=Phanerochaete sordida TaxID=48140 RepID=A0A9P3LAX5_9APHY|nr:hypothetical protein PsYK624_040520 [Phanerochaete sordida]